MAVPSIVAAEAPWNGSAWGDMVEEALNERGLTNPSYASTNALMTSADASQVARAKKCVQEALSEVQGAFLDRWPMSEDDATAATPFTRVLLPLDFGSFGRGGAYIAGVRLKIIGTEEYAANVRSTSDGGGVVCADVAGDPTHARVVLVTNSESSVTYYRKALEVYPVQTAAFTLHVIYHADAKAITSDTVVVRVPVALQAAVEDLVRSNWRKKVGDTKGAMEFRKIALDTMESFREVAGDSEPLRAKCAVPNESARRWA